MWGLNSNGLFNSGCDYVVNRGSSLLSRNSHQRTTIEQLRVDVHDCYFSAHSEYRSLLLSKASSVNVSQRILGWFQKDLVDGLLKRFLETQEQRNKVVLMPVHWETKALALAVLSLEISFMLFYTFLFGLTKRPEQQKAWAYAFIVWIVLDVVVFATVRVMIHNVIIPILMIPELSKVRDRVLATATNVTLTVMTDQPAADNMPFNAAKYLFVSHRLAKSFCGTNSIARVILQYQTIWPSKEYGVAAHGPRESFRIEELEQLSVFLFNLMLITFNRMIALPIQLQDLTVESMCIATVGAIIRLHRYLYEIHPWLSFLPTAACFGFGIMRFVNGRQRRSITVFPNAPTQDRVVPQSPQSGHISVMDMQMQMHRRQTLQVQRMGDVNFIEVDSLVISDSQSSDFQNSLSVSSYPLSLLSEDSYSDT